MDSRARRFSILALVLLTASFLLAEEIPNWTVPPYGGARPAGELSTMTDTSPGVAFVAMSPCRVFDTRNANGPYGGPRLLANVTRNFDIDSGPCTGIPVGVDAYSMNFGAILADGIGFVTIWPTGVAQPTVSSINTIPGYVLANAAIVPAGTNGSISIFPNTGMHLYGDINGYFTDQYNPGVSFHAVSTTAAPAILAENTSTAVGAAAIRGVITSTTPASSSAAVRGINNSTTGSGIGVWGSHSGSGIGVVGEAQLNGIGVQGAVLGGSEVSFGVEGQTASTHLGSAGVFGTAGGVTAAYGDRSFAGVRGESQVGIGVLGVTGFGSEPASVAGIKVDNDNDIILSGNLAFGSYGVYSIGDAYVVGNLTVTGLINGAMKPFVQPHPLDPSKEIRYVSLEGPHSEVYFRGTAQIAQGISRIPIPEDFRLVADPETYSTLVTPVGEMATVAVVAEGREGVVVKASRDVRVHFVVYAERDAMRNPDPIIPNADFRPAPDGGLVKRLPESYRRLMTQNHTLNPDGTVNMETARRLGWDKEWDKRGRPVAQSVSD
jgi:hypothetical protein